jgi:hypothetical protein
MAFIMRRSMSFWQSIRAAVSPTPISQAKANQLNAEPKEFFDKLVTTGKISGPDNIPIVLGADEAALLHEPSKLIEARATRVHSGGGVGVMKGVYIGAGQSSSVQGLKKIDSGTLTLTNKRLVFTGSMESRVVTMKDIVSVEPLPDGIEVSTGQKAKRQIYLVHNPVIWTMLVRYFAEGKLSANVIKPVDSSADVRFSCPGCGQHLSVEQRGVGSAVNCPNCNQQIEIPQGQHETAATTATFPYGSLKSPAFSCVSMTLPASS